MYQKILVTFADSTLKKSLVRIKNQAKDIQVYDKIFAFNESDLSDDFKKTFQDKLIVGSRGYGYWSWKPQIILQALDLINDGDVIQYTDSGCHINIEGKNRLIEYFDMAYNSNNGFLVFEVKPPDTPLLYDGRYLPNWTDSMWTKGDLIDFFNVRTNDNILNTPTLGAGIFFIRKTQKTIDFMKRWLDIMKENFHLVDDSLSISPNTENFIDHRHDQSIFSIMCKLENIETRLSTCEYFYPLSYNSKKNSFKADWYSLKKFPIHAKRDKYPEFKIIFYNHLHNGDVYTSKKFVQQVYEELSDFKIAYYHQNHSSIIKDLNIETNIVPESFIKTEKIIKRPTDMIINTWVGSYSKKYTNDPPFFYTNGINLIDLKNMWEFIFNNINEHFDVNLKLKEIDYYIPDIDFKQYDVNYIKQCLEYDPRKKILISNNIPRSKQSIDSDFSNIINFLSKKYQNILFICTNKFNTDQNNIVFTEDLTNNLTGCDINEISFISTFCDLIIGKNSGPFIFCLTKENFLKKKIFISFNHEENDCFIKGTSFTSQYIHSNNFDEENIIKIISGNIRC